MRDYEEVAVEVRKKIKINHIEYCHAGSAYCANCYLADKLIAEALRQAAKEAYEDAACIAEEHWATKFPQSGFARASKDIASSIRKKKEEVK